MMPEIALNVLDIAQNSIKAEAGLIQICVKADTTADRMEIVIEDDGSGMTGEQLDAVQDPFFTTRTTRKVGLGVPFFKYSAECTGGEFQIDSAPGKGTKVTAVYVLSSIDRMPLGDMPETMYTLIVFHTDLDFVYRYEVDDRGFVLDTREFKEILGGVPLDAPEVAAYIKEYLTENTAEVNAGIYL